MATIYNIKVKTVSPFCAYDEKYIKNMFEKFLKEYRDENNGLGFESTEVEVESNPNCGEYHLSINEIKNELKYRLNKYQIDLKQYQKKLSKSDNVIDSKYYINHIEELEIKSNELRMIISLL